MSYQLNTDLEGKVSNLPDFRSEALYPLFEAVVNSIHAIWEADNLQDGKIVVHVHRQAELYAEDIDDNIIAFEIEDNGIGFNTENMKSFMTADSTYKKHLGCKGIGRFLWLKAFNKVEIDSTYTGDDGFHHRRKIYFSLGGGITPGLEESANGTLKTIVKLLDFKPAYRSLPTAYKTTSKIAQRILEHCLSYYITDKAPDIVIKDDDSEYELSEMYADIRDAITTELIQLEGIDFVIHHMKLYSTYEKMHKLFLCANGRDVMYEGIGKILGMSGQFDEDGQKFVYAVYVTSNYLDANVDSSRMSFSIPVDGTTLVFS
ncbi:MAG: ATP-binding protein [Armatimonadota bacterium]